MWRFLASLLIIGELVFYVCHSQQQPTHNRITTGEVTFNAGIYMLHNPIRQRLICPRVIVIEQIPILSLPYRIVRFINDRIYILHPFCLIFLLWEFHYFLVAWLFSNWNVLFPTIITNEVLAPIDSLVPRKYSKSFSFDYTTLKYFYYHFWQLPNILIFYQ